MRSVFRPFARRYPLAVGTPSPTARVEPRSLTHVPALDGVRGIAVLLVIATHTMIVFWYSHFYDVVPGGFLGVDLFFVLSGFLITSLLLGEQARTDRVSMPGFYRRRALRLLPALVALVVLHAIYTIVTGLPFGIEARTITVVMLYVSNWYAATGHRLALGLNHLWSLSIEEQFYLLWPLVIAVLLTVRRSSRVVVGSLIAAIVAVAVWRAYLWHPGASLLKVSPEYVRTDTRADALLMGALAAHLWVRGRIPRRGLATAALIAAVFFGYCVVRIPGERGFYYKGGFTLIALAAAIVLVATVENRWIGTRVCAWRPLRAVGIVSYGLYLWHLPVFFGVRRYTTGWPVGLQIALALTLTVAFTLASWRFIETPFLRRKARRSPARSPVVAAAPSAIPAPTV